MHECGVSLMDKGLQRYCGSGVMGAREIALLICDTKRRKKTTHQYQNRIVVIRAIADC
jgi:hypothetical protein